VRATRAVEGNIGPECECRRRVRSTDAETELCDVHFIPEGLRYSKDEKDVAESGECPVLDAGNGSCRFVPYIFR
jgi:hypothetical protein